MTLRPTESAALDPRVQTPSPSIMVNAVVQPKGLKTITNLIIYLYTNSEKILNVVLGWCKSNRDFCHY